MKTVNVDRLIKESSAAQRRRRSQSNALAQPEASEEFEVESIVDSRTLDGQVFYLVKWRGFTARHNSWEPAYNLVHAQALIDNFSSRSGRLFSVGV